MCQQNIVNPQYFQTIFNDHEKELSYKPFSLEMYAFKTLHFLGPRKICLLFNLCKPDEKIQLVCGCTHELSSLQYCLPVRPCTVVPGIQLVQPDKVVPGKQLVQPYTVVPASIH